MASPSSSLLDFTFLRTKNNGALEERGQRGEAAESKGNALVRRGLAYLSHQEPAGATGAEAGGGRQQLQETGSGQGAEEEPWGTGNGSL